MGDNTKEPADNGAVLNIAKIICNVMLSAVAAEIGALFINTRLAIPTRTLLAEMGHPQPATPVQTDNTTAHGLCLIVRNKISKSIFDNHAISILHRYFTCQSRQWSRKIMLRRR